MPHRSVFDARGAGPSRTIDRAVAATTACSSPMPTIGELPFDNGVVKTCTRPLAEPEQA